MRRRNSRRPRGCARRAQAMFEFLVSHWVRQGCRDWDGLTQEARDAFIDTVALHVEGFRAAELEG